MAISRIPYVASGNPLSGFVGKVLAVYTAPSLKRLNAEHPRRDAYGAVLGGNVA